MDFNFFFRVRVNSFRILSFQPFYLPFHCRYFLSAKRKLCLCNCTSFFTNSDEVSTSQEKKNVKKFSEGTGLPKEKKNFNSTLELSSRQCSVICWNVKQNVITGRWHSRSHSSKKLWLTKAYSIYIFERFRKFYLVRDVLLSKYKESWPLLNNILKLIFFSVMIFLCFHAFLACTMSEFFDLCFFTFFQLLQPFRSNKSRLSTLTSILWASECMFSMLKTSTLHPAKI